MRISFSLLYLLLVFNSAIFSQNNSWEFKKNENSIKIHTRYVDGSSFKEFRGEMTVSSKISEVAGILKNITKYKEWMEDIEKVELLNEDEDNIYYYAESSVPWPFDNRDLVYHLRIIKKNDSEAEFIVTGISDYIPEKKGIVRIEKAIGFWKLTLLKENKVHIIYQLHVEPSGAIPAWLANSKVVDMPYATLTGLRDMINKK